MQLDLWAAKERKTLIKKGIPRHIAIIMDGNGRWAQKRGLPRIAGHAQGAEALKRTVEESIKLGVKNLSVYAFSTENWKRPKEEISGLMQLFIDTISRSLDQLIKNGICIKFLGELSKFPAEIQKMIELAQDKSKTNNRLILNILFNYGSRLEIVQAINKILATGKKSISENDFSEYLYTAGIPDPELLIRTSGEYRLSNFLLWQSAYAEFWFTKKNWPEFNGKLLREAIFAYQKRQRRQGGI